MILNNERDLENYLHERAEDTDAEKAGVNVEQVIRNVLCDPMRPAWGTDWSVFLYRHPDVARMQ